MIIVIYGLTCKFYTHIVIRTPRPQNNSNWDNRRGWLWCEDHMCSLSVNALLRYSIKRSTLITSSFPWAPAANGLVGQKMSCKFLIASTYDYLRNTCLWLFGIRMLYFIYLQLPMSWLLHELSCPCNAHSSIPMPTVFNPTVTIDTVVVFTLLLLLLSYYCHHYKTVATDKPLRASLFPGAAELITHLLRLINILWLPLCRINKFGFYFLIRLKRIYNFWWSMLVFTPFA
jgi:hypothetical protein